MERSVSLPLLVWFGLSILVGLVLLARASRSKALWITAIGWIALQSAISLTGFYTVTGSLPPRLALALGPPVLLAFGIAFLPTAGPLRDAMNVKWTVLLHSIRIMVEIALFWLFTQGQVPKLLTFEGGNIDILAGLTAPLAWWAFRTGRIGRKGLLAWNSLGLLTLANAVIRALLSTPSPLQKFGFSQPNIAILHFPFVLLPAFLVPSVLFCHLVLFRIAGRRAE